MPHATNTIFLFWIAFYNDGSMFRQYEMDGTHHLFKEIDQSRLVRFGWFPFTAQLAKRVGEFAVANPLLGHFVIRLKKGQRLIALRREYHHQFSFSQCLSCGFRWQWMPNRKNGEIGNAGLPIYNQDYSYYVMNRGKRVYQVVCPKCGARNELECPDCKEPVSKVKTEDGQIIYKCLKCNKQYPRFTQSMSAVKVEDIFMLGYQETVDGKNIKYIMFIRPDGTFEFSNDFNAL